MGVAEPLSLVPGTNTATLYGSRVALESFRCSFGVDPAIAPALEAAGLVTTGRGPAGETRSVELRGHPYFVATLFLPQLRPPEAGPHPLLAAFRDAVLARR